MAVRVPEMTPVTIPVLVTVEVLVMMDVAVAVATVVTVLVELTGFDEVLPVHVGPLVAVADGSVGSSLVGEDGP